MNNVPTITPTEVFLMTFVLTFFLFGYFVRQAKYHKEVWAQHDSCVEYSNFGKDDLEKPLNHDDRREHELYVECMQGGVQ